MNPNPSIPEEMVPVVLEKAGQLYQQQQDPEHYSLEELQQAGAEVQLPSELIQRAYEELQREQRAAALRAEQRQRQMHRGGAIAAALTVLAAIWTGSTYNQLNAQRTAVEGRWAQVENQMQRRADLIPQLTQVAQHYASAEQQIIRQLSQAQEKFADATTAEQKQAADADVKAAIAQFQTLASRNPTLQSSELFINLQYEIAGTENRIATERKRYNEAIAAYNRSVQGFPTVLVASPLGFEAQTFFEAGNLSELD